MNTASRTCISV